jgi:uncharacterized protein
MRRAPVIVPLREVEVEQLQAELEAGKGGMRSVHEVRGAFAALATAPGLVSPNAWLHIVLGEPAFADMEHAQRVFDVLMRDYNFVLDEMENEHPVAPGPDVPDEIAAAWCRGYLTIAEADREWRADEDADGLLLPLAVIAGTFSLIGERDDDGKVIEDDGPHRRKARAVLDQIVRELYGYWTSRRRVDALKSAVAKAKAPGRNERCPCGSGKKYKRCCGLVH